MRQVNLNGVFYSIHSDIQQRRISPWKAKLGSSSGVLYSDFSQAELEEYFDFRNGIGKKRGVGSDARQDFSQGIDFANEGQATLGPLINTADYPTWAANTAYTAGAASALFSFVIPSTPDGFVYECTTAGTSHATTEPTWDAVLGNTTVDNTVTWTCRAYLASVKIIDFESSTYCIQNSRILKWDGTNLTCVDNTFASPIDAIVITDSTDSYLVVSSATSSLYTTDGTTWAELLSWKTPDSTNDPSTHWTSDANAIDGSTSTAASSTQDAPDYLEFLLTNALFTDRARIYYIAVSCTSVVVDFYYNEAWHNIYSGIPTQNQWVTVTNSAGLKLVSKMRMTVNVVGNTKYIYEVAIAAPMAGYLADFENRLYGITSDGKTVTRSASKNIDSPGSAFEITGNYGTVYDFFEGKLLADGTPTVYFCGTEGLFSLDTTNEIAYKQEVAYPPLTNAGNVGIYWNANVWVATGYGILKVAPSMATFVGPDQDDGLPSTYQGKVYDFATVNNWLVFCVNGGSTDKSSILKRNSTLGGNQQVYTTSAVNKAIACLHHSSSSLYTNGRLWFGEGTTIKYGMMPDTTSNVKQIATYAYVNDSGYGTLPIFRKLAAISKTALGVAAITKSCDANEYVQVFYGLNGAAATTSLGTFITSPKPTALTFNSGLGTVFYTIQLAVKLFRGNTTTNSPELESLMFYYLPTPSRISAWTFTVMANEDDSQEIFEAFEIIYDTNTLVAFFPSGDTAKTSYNVKLTQMPSRSWWEEAGAREGQFQVQVEEVFNG